MSLNVTDALTLLVLRVNSATWKHTRWSSVWTAANVVG